MVFLSSGQLPEPPWSSKRTDRRARPVLTRESITDAALKIVDAEGLEAVSMRRLATELGVQASALYSHVSGKAELIQLLIDRVAAELEVPEPDPARWQEQLKEVLRGMYRGFLRHRDLAGATLANIPTGANVLAFTDRLLALLRAGGLSRQAAAYAVDLLAEFVAVGAYEWSLYERRLEREPEYFDAVEQYYRALPAARFPVLADLVGELVSPDESPEARFEFKLDVIVRGLASLAGES
jgi:AcrR family transcriptional regulator